MEGSVGMEYATRSPSRHIVLHVGVLAVRRGDDEATTKSLHRLFARSYDTHLLELLSLD